MKYVIALLFALTFSKIDAQNLQFSQVLTFSGTQPTSGFTVPQNKVWKVESAGTVFANYYVNGAEAISSTLIANGNYRPNSNSFPIWLKSGDTIQPGNVGTNSYNYFISIVEFTIVP